ncbi:MAG: hypothetical protein ACKPKO_32440 [Candidatus Fonsibacter sp.]
MTYWDDEYCLKKEEIINRFKDDLISFNEAISLTNIIKDEINEKVKFDPSSGLFNPNYKIFCRTRNTKKNKEI